MSGFGSFSGFGQNTGQNTGGFGSTNNNAPNTGFGSGFAANTNPNTNNANPFGATSSTGGFGSGGGFGQSSSGSSLFGQNKPAFGAPSSSGTGLFGNTTTTGSGGFGSSTGGFGANAANNTSSNPFGGTSAGGGFSFGQSKPAFGNGTTSGTGTGLFGSSSGNASNAGFGGTQSNPFGQAGAGTALGPGVPPSDGTAVTPFNPTNEKDPTGNGTNSFQSINFMPAYQKYSFEELRQADYDKGRRFGSATGQTGTFGNANFGGMSNAFGTSNNAHFGGANSNNAFGSSNTGGGAGFGSGSNATGLGNNTAGSSSLFGGGSSNNATQGTGLFGSQASSSQSGGLFGASGVGTGFGNTNNATSSFGATSGSTGAFGSNANQNKPSLFGSNTGTSGTGGSLFGGGNAGGQTGQAGFGTNQTNQNSNPFGGLGAQSNQSQEQNKPGGLFGGSTFGTSQASQSQPSNSLFGAAQPAPGGGGLFGNTNAATTGQGLGGFGGTNQQNAGASGGAGGLFGTANTQQQKPGLFASGTGAFGTSQNQNAGGLFGGASGSTSQQQGGGLFGQGVNPSTQLFGGAQPQNAGGLGMNQQNASTQNNSLLGGQAPNPLLNNSQQNQQNASQAQGLHSSLLDGNPFGQSSIWSGLPDATPQNSGPLVTPLSASQRLKESQMKTTPSLRLSSANLLTPQRRQGFGLSYSNYGTPNSAASTPSGWSINTGNSYGRQFTGGSFSRSLTKSFSASNLRQQSTVDGEGILSPGAFAPGSSRYSSGSIRRLTIDRNLKTDLFARPSPSLPALPPSGGDSQQIRDSAINGGEDANGNPTTEPVNRLKKRVSFDQDATRGMRENVDGGTNIALACSESDGSEPSAEEQGFLRSSRKARLTNGSASSTSNTDQARGNELAVVPEDRESETVVSKMRLPVDAVTAVDAKPGEYWMKPSRAELSKMSREELQHFKGLQVGRHGCGMVTFDEEVDLTSLRLDDLFGKLVEIRVRSITVYPDSSTKPPPGRGLNVPSTLHLDNSWPRSRGRAVSTTKGQLFERHVVRLRQMENTTFIDYNGQTGVWTFRVDHYTRYGLDYDDETSMGEHNDVEDAESNQVGDFADEIDQSMDLEGTAADDSSMMEDTFEFKKRSVPGDFDRLAAFPPRDRIDGSDVGGSLPESVDGSKRYPESVHEASNAEMSMAGAFPMPGQDTHAAKSTNESLLGISHDAWETPSKPLIDLDGDWTEQLRKTISPRKQNRQQLRENQDKLVLEHNVNFSLTKQPSFDQEHEIKTNIDLMKSLFGQHEARMAKNKRRVGQAKNIESPFPKHAEMFDASADMASYHQQQHKSFPVKWTPEGSLIYARPGTKADQFERDGSWRIEELARDREKVVWKSSLAGDERESNKRSQWQWDNARVTMADGIPFAKQKPIKFAILCEQIADRNEKRQTSPESQLELDIYRLAHVLFDKYDDEFSLGLSASQKSKFADRIRRDRLSHFWSMLIQERHPEIAGMAEDVTDERQALMLLTSHHLAAACRQLGDSGDLYLSTMIAQLDEADDSLRHEMAEQIHAWRNQNIISEMSEPIRALYELIAGNTTVSHGNTQGPFEHRASTFTISERFGLDWMQAFGLCLWYGKAKNGTVQDIVQEFASKLARDEESAKPYSGGQAGGRHEHPLWVLLQLYAATKGEAKDAPTLPLALSPLVQSFDNRIAFQLHHALVANIPTISIETSLADKLAVDLAFELSASGASTAAVFVLMHLSDGPLREFHIRNLLDRHGRSLPQLFDRTISETGTTHPDWLFLVGRLKIPDIWIANAKALYYRSLNEHFHELKYLIRGDQWEDAHECFSRRVAPRAVIEEDWELIVATADLFGKRIQNHVSDWSTGGGMYSDFVAFLVEEVKRTKNSGDQDESASSGEQGVTKDQAAQESVSRIMRLQSSLAEVAHSFKTRGSHLTAGGFDDELEQRVACHEMARILTDVMVERQLTSGARHDNNKTEKSSKPNELSLVNLPLTADVRLKHARSMAVDHYRALMNGNTGPMPAH